MIQIRYPTKMLSVTGKQRELQRDRVTGNLRIKVADRPPRFPQLREHPRGGESRLMIKRKELHFTQKSRNPVAFTPTTAVRHAELQFHHDNRRKSDCLSHKGFGRSIPAQ